MQGPLPALTRPTTIDGSGPNGKPGIVLDGAHAGSNPSGLGVTGGSSTIRGLVFSNFSGPAVSLLSNDNKVQGDYFGTDLTGMTAAPLGSSCISVTGANNTIGGTGTANRNVISGVSNSQYAAVSIYGSGATGNVVQGNYIGTDVTGNGGLGNAGAGVDISQNASNNTIGGDANGARNVIGGSDPGRVGFGAVQIDSGASNNKVQGDYIGIGQNGIARIPNYYGVLIRSGAHDNLIGGTSALARNVISMNTFGIVIIESGTKQNQVQGNYIGTCTDGTSQSGWGNDAYGVYVLDSASDTLIGGTDPAAANVISGNAQCGVCISSPGDETNTTVEGNYVGTDKKRHADARQRHGNLRACRQKHHRCPRGREHHRRQPARRGADQRRRQQGPGQLHRH